MYVDHCHQLFSSLFVVRQISQKDFYFRSVRYIVQALRASHIKIIKKIENKNQNRLSNSHSFLSAHLFLMHRKTRAEAEQAICVC